MAGRVLKNEIKYKITLDDDQKKVKESIFNNQIVVITGFAGSGKSLVAAQTALDLLFKKEVKKIYVTRANVVTGRDMGYLPGDITDKLNPYLEAFKENLYACYDKDKVDKHIQSKEIDGTPLAYIRGKTIQDILVVEEAQNLTKHEMLAILTRLGKNGRIIINGDVNQSDIKDSHTGLHYAIELSKRIEGIEYFKLKNNHRSDLVGKILDYEYSGNNLKDTNQNEDN
ncbi:MAG: PhoH family protein [Lachnospiraceae bacterium]|jgi:phosphate starvation-inducible PhoH-like protein|nr:PhoH family protein [Lachnospiraceae bacterium]